MVLKKLRLLLILLGLFFFVAVFGHLVSPSMKSFFYAVSLTLKQCLLFVIPFIIFSLVLHALVSLKGGVFGFIVKLVSCVYISNFTAIMIAYTLSSNILPYIQQPIEQGAQLVDLVPLWNFRLPASVPNEVALIAGLLFGLFFSLYPTAWSNRFAAACNTMANIFLRKIFIPLLPLFILGFMFNLESKDLLTQIVSKFGPVFGVVLGTQIAYIVFLYAVASGFNLSRFIEYIKNILPATLTAFSSMSSIATMPVTMVSTEQNLKSSSLARLIIPATVNIHTLGSAIGLTTLAVAAYLAFMGSLPPFSVFIVYAIWYAGAKFSVAAVPGGAVAVAMPLMEKYLGFSTDITTLIMTSYMFLDPFGTATNVTGNGAFALLFKKIARLKIPAEDAAEVEEDGRLLAEGGIAR